MNPLPAGSIRKPDVAGEISIIGKSPAGQLAGRRIVNWNVNYKNNSVDNKLADCYTCVSQKVRNRTDPGRIKAESRKRNEYGSS